MTNEELRAGLVALRFQVDGLLRALDAELAAPDPAERGPACEHPEDAREDASTMGRRRFRCRACGAIVTE